MDWLILKGKGCCQQDSITAESAGTQEDKIKVVYDLRGSGSNRYSMCEGGLLLHLQYDAVQIGFIT